MRGLKKTAPDGTEPQTSGHGDSMTNSAQRGRVGENKTIYNKLFGSEVITMLRLGLTQRYI